MDLSDVERPIVAPVSVDRAGRRSPTLHEARGSGWRRSSRGLYVPAGVDGSDRHQRVAEAAAVLPEYGGVTGWGALSWCGSRWFDGGDLAGVQQGPVVLAIGSSRVRAQPGIGVSEERLQPQDLMLVDGIRITTMARAVLFEMRYAAHERQAVVVLDMAAYDDLVSLAEAAAYAATLGTHVGIPMARRALALAVENSWSPRETLMRLIWTLDAGLPQPLCNAPVFDLRGRHLGTPDLLDPVTGVVGEYEGGLHLEGRRRSKDLNREELFRSHSLEYVTMVGADHRDPTQFVTRLHGAYARAARHPMVDRSWTTVQPPWWVDTSTVVARRALAHHERTIWLRHRAG